MAKSQYSWLLVAYGVSVDDDGFFLVFGGSIDLGTVASLGFIATHLIEELPVTLGEVVHEGVKLVGAGLRVLLLEVEQQF